MEGLYSNISALTINWIKELGSVNTHLADVDGWRWSVDRHGSYSIKSGYSWIIQNRGSSQLPWNWVWRHGVPENINRLLWLIYKEVVPTNSLHHYRGMSDTVLCSICRYEPETLLHLVGRCPWVRNLWTLARFVTQSRKWDGFQIVAFGIFG